MGEYFAQNGMGAVPRRTAPPPPMPSRARHGAHGVGEFFAASGVGEYFASNGLGEFFVPSSGMGEFFVPSMTGMGEYFASNGLGDIGAMTPATKYTSGGAVAGLALGALLWKKKRVAGALLGAVLGAGAGFAASYYAA